MSLPSKLLFGHDVHTGSSVTESTSSTSGLSGPISAPTTQGGADLLVILVPVCVVLGLLVIGGVLLVVLLCLKRGRSNQVTKEEHKEERGM